VVGNAFGAGGWVGFAAAGGAVGDAGGAAGAQLSESSPTTVPINATLGTSSRLLIAAPIFFRSEPTRGTLMDQIPRLVHLLDRFQRSRS